MRVARAGEEDDQGLNQKASPYDVANAAKVSVLAG
jgi:hypothetical protein